MQINNRQDMIDFLTDQTNWTAANLTEFVNRYHYTHYEVANKYMTEEFIKFAYENIDGSIKNKLFEEFFPSLNDVSFKDLFLELYFNKFASLSSNTNKAILLQLLSRFNNDKTKKYLMENLYDYMLTQLKTTEDSQIFETIDDQYGLSRETYNLNISSETLAYLGEYLDKNVIGVNTRCFYYMPQDLLVKIYGLQKYLGFEDIRLYNLRSISKMKFSKEEILNSIDRILEKDPSNYLLNMIEDKLTDEEYSSILEKLPTTSRRTNLYIFDNQNPSLDVIIKFGKKFKWTDGIFNYYIEDYKKIVDNIENGNIILGSSVAPSILIEEEYLMEHIKTFYMWIERATKKRGSGYPWISRETLKKFNASGGTRARYYEENFTFRNYFDDNGSKISKESILYLIPKTKPTNDDISYTWARKSGDYRWLMRD